MSLKSSEKVETNVWQLEISIDADRFEKAVNDAFLKQRKNITVHGFRKGKAPRSFIEKIYGVGVFYEDALEALYPDVVEEAIREAALEVVDTPFDLEVPEMGKNGVTLKLKVTVKPDVKLGKYKGLKATRKPSKVSADEVKAQLDRMRTAPRKTATRSSWTLKASWTASPLRAARPKATNSRSAPASSSPASRTRLSAIRTATNLTST